MHHITDRGKQVFGGFLFAMILLSAGCQQAPQAAAPPPQTAVDPVKLGEYLVTTSGCHDCHTPWKMGPNGPEPDMTRMLSGHPESLKITPPPKFDMEVWGWAGSNSMTAFAGPWGISYAANLTPDENTGIGIWDEAMFIKTLRNGRHMGDGRPLVPPMPWPWYGKKNDEDLKAIFAYLRSIPPIVNRVPEYQEPGM